MNTLDKARLGDDSVGVSHGSLKQIMITDGTQWNDLESMRQQRRQRLQSQLQDPQLRAAKAANITCSSLPICLSARHRSPCAAQVARQVLPEHTVQDSPKPSQVTSGRHSLADPLMRMSDSNASVRSHSSSAIISRPSVPPKPPKIMAHGGGLCKHEQTVTGRSLGGHRPAPNEHATEFSRAACALSRMRTSCQRSSSACGRLVPDNSVSELSSSACASHMSHAHNTCERSVSFLEKREKRMANRFRGTSCDDRHSQHTTTGSPGITKPSPTAVCGLGYEGSMVRRRSVGRPSESRLKGHLDCRMREMYASSSRRSIRTPIHTPIRTPIRTPLRTRTSSFSGMCSQSRQPSPSPQAPRSMKVSSNVLSAQALSSRFCPIRPRESEDHFSDFFAAEDNIPCDIETENDCNAITTASHHDGPSEVNQPFFSASGKVSPKALAPEFAEALTDCTNSPVTSPPPSHKNNPFTYNIDTSFEEASTSAAPSKATSDSIISDNSIAPTIDRLVHENKTLKEVVLDANRRLTRLEDEKWHFFNEGVFDLVNSICGREISDGKPAAINRLLIEDESSTALESVQDASENHIFVNEQERASSSEQFVNNIPREVTNAHTGDEPPCLAECLKINAACSIATQERHAILDDNVTESSVSDAVGRIHSIVQSVSVDSDPKLHSLEEPCMQPPCSDVGGKPLKGGTMPSSIEESKFDFFLLGLTSPNAFTIPLDLNDSGDISFDTSF